MQSHSSLANALTTYNHAIDDLTARVVQDRTLHKHDMNNLYMQAASEGMHDGYLSTLERAISDRSTYGQGKNIMDAVDLTAHQQKLKSALGHNKRVLSGGGVADNSPRALQGMQYAVRRSRDMVSNFNRKLAQDRELHRQELQALNAITPRNSMAKQLVGGMVERRNEVNAARQLHDATVWAEADAHVAHTLNGGGHMEEEDEEFQFESDEAAALWDQIQGSNGVY